MDTTTWIQFHDTHSYDMTLISDIPPPLRSKGGELEYQDQREHWQFVDYLLDQHWRGRNSFESVKGGEYTYGEVTPLGVRQLCHEMNFDIHDRTRRHDDNGEEQGDGVVFYDLGSGVGRLVVQLYLDQNYDTDYDGDPNHSSTTKSEKRFFKNIVGVELCDRRHAIAIESWEAVQETLENILPQKEAALSQLQKEQEVVVFLNQNILETDFSDATHLFISSLCFPPEVTKRLSEIILENVSKNNNENKKGTLKVVSALSDLPLFEQKEEMKRWTKTTRSIQMTWGGSLVRTYTYID